MIPLIEDRENNSEDGIKEWTKRLKLALMVLSGKEMFPEFYCSIDYCIMKDPVIAADGFTYSRGGITRWLANSNKSPLTGLTLDSKNLIPNLTLKSVIMTYLGE